MTTSTPNLRPSGYRRLTGLGVLFLAAAVATPQAVLADALEYGVQFEARLVAGVNESAAVIRISQPAAQLKTLRLDMPPGRFSGLAGDGRITRKGNYATWKVPPRGGELRYRVKVTHERNSKGFDAYIGPQWALFRAEDIFPPASATMRPGALGRGELVLDLPDGWSALTPYLPDDAGRLAVDRRGRSYERPVGWILAGRIGARKDEIGPLTVRVAGPVGGPAPRVRVPTLALLRWTLPVLQAQVPLEPRYLLIVTAGDPMWRGGLSAPNSLYFHADRPIIGEDGTSTLLHEILHVLAPVPAARDHDWIDEALAEYVAMVLLLRSDTISRERFDHTITQFRKRGQPVRSLAGRNSAGAVTARAVVLFHDLDLELQARSRGKSDIFSLLRRLMQEDNPVDTARLREIAAEIAGGKSLKALARGNMPDTG